MRLALAAVLLVLLPSPLPAATLTWPGIAPCATTLQACIDSANVTDTVLVDSNGPIDESLTFFKAMNLQAAPGRRPVFVADRYIFGVLPANGNLLIEGLTLTRGRILGGHTGGSGTLRIRRMRVLDTAEAEEAIKVYSTSTTGTLTFDIYDNDVRHRQDISDGAIRGAIAVGSFSNSAMTGKIESNRVEALGSAAYGIALTSGGSLTANVLGNRIRGGNRGGLYFFIGGSGGNLSANALNNVVTPSALGVTDSQGISSQAQAGTMALNLYNNTVVDSLYGLDIYASPGADLIGAAVNNLIAYNTIGISIPAGFADSFPNHHNLVHGNSSNSYTPGPSTLTTDPLLINRSEPRLRQSSPARNTGDSAALNGVLSGNALAALDGDGLRRFDGVVDMGAYEYGSFSYTHRNTAANTLLNNTELSHPRLNGQSSARPQATPNWNPPGSSGVYNDHNIGMYYIGSNWIVFNQDELAMPNNAAFNIFSPALRATHSVSGTPAATSTLAIAEITNQFNTLVLITPHWNASGPGVYNDHPIGNLYFSPNWSVLSLDVADLPTGADFNIYYQPLSVNAFVHTAVNANRSANVTYLDHRLLNGTRCAAVHVTQAGNGGVFNAHPIGVFYSSGRQQWAIFNQDIAIMPEFATFHVLVDPGQVADCGDRIFEDDFES